MVSRTEQHAREAALKGLATSAASNIPGVDFASITIRRKDRTLHTVAATDPVAEQVDAIQYELREGPCYAAVTRERLVLLNDVASASDFPRYGPRAANLGVGSQLAMQLLHNSEQAGLNLYAHKSEAFDRSTVQLAELFATQAAALLGYAEQVEQLTEALHTRTDIGTAMGILMERYGIDRNAAFAFLSRNSQNRNTKVRHLAQQVIDGTFESTPHEDSHIQNRP
jgi:GAF domain-containing protein